MTSTNFAIELLEKMNAFCRLHSEYVLDDIKVVKEGEIIFRAGERPRGVYFICKGCVKVISTEDGNEALLTRLAGSNEMIGYVSMISETEYRSTAIAIRDSELQFIPKDIFIELLRSNVEFTNLMLQILCADIKEIKGNQLDYHKKNGKQRLAALLLSFDLAWDKFKDENIFNCIPRKEIAGKIAVTPETISRYLADFKKRGYLREDQGTITIINKSALLRLSKVNN